ncbi:MAG: hypothetical protein LBE14_04625, partial [Treponema sp.]|nr:hypothetical protein [Treponema sp.]
RGLKNNAMAELILNNLPFVLFIVIAVAVRTLQARARARRGEAPPVFASALEPDDEEETEADPVKPDEAALINYAQTRGASAYVAEKARALMTRLAEEPPRFETIPGLNVVEGPAFPPGADSPAPEVKKTAPAAMQEGRAKRGGSFPALEQFTPPQRAVVWAEILGKPKGTD